FPLQCCVLCDNETVSAATGGACPVSDTGYRDGCPRGGGSLPCSWRSMGPFHNVLWGLLLFRLAVEPDHQSAAILLRAGRDNGGVWVCDRYSSHLGFEARRPPSPYF